jgi:hypothetical protein
MTGRYVKSWTQAVFAAAFVLSLRPMMIVGSDQIED